MPRRMCLLAVSVRVVTRQEELLVMAAADDESSEEEGAPPNDISYTLSASRVDCG